MLVGHGCEAAALRSILACLSAEGLCGTTARVHSDDQGKQVPDDVSAAICTDVWIAAGLVDVIVANTVAVCCTAASSQDLCRGGHITCGADRLDSGQIRLMSEPVWLEQQEQIQVSPHVQESAAKCSPSSTSDNKVSAGC